MLSRILLAFAAIVVALANTTWAQPPGSSTAPQSAPLRYSGMSFPSLLDGTAAQGRSGRMRPVSTIRSTAEDQLVPDSLLVPDPASAAKTGGDDLLAAPPSASGLDELEAMSKQPPRQRSLPGAGHGQDAAARGGLPAGVDPHAEVFAETLYPSALKCAKCHKKIYDEWRVSAHAYAAVSPMFQCFEQKMTELTKGTVGYFCVRCHAPVATQMEYPREASIVDGPAVFREGITCVACHRVVERYGRVNGERRIEPGSIFDPVVGNLGGQGVQRVLADADQYKVKIDPADKRPGTEMHRGAIQFEQLSESGFCVSCHQVAVHPGVALEVVWAQYRASPARARGVTCQDCHMGVEPGKALGYECGPAAEVNGKVVDANRKHSNHMFHGPGNPIAHPGVFPHNEKSLRWTVEQWLEFDWRAGWGTPQFENQITAARDGGTARSDGTACFPPTWAATDERRDARKVLDENFELLAKKRESAQRVMNNAARIGGPVFASSRRAGEDLVLRYDVHNISDGHNMPSGSLGAQPQLWLNVVLTGPDGRWLWETGYLDGNGDLADQHSLYVQQGRLRPDHQLLNLQTKFLITGVKGTDREMYLPVNVDVDQLPFLRPGALPITVLNHPPLIRMEAHSVPPLGARTAHYRIPGHLLQQPGTYRLSARLRSRMEPIYFMRFCGSTPEMERRMLEQLLDVAPQAVEFEIR